MSFICLKVEIFCCPFYRVKSLPTFLRFICFIKSESLPFADFNTMRTGMLILVLYTMGAFINHSLFFCCDKYLFWLAVQIVCVYHWVVYICSIISLLHFFKNQILSFLSIKSFYCVK